MTAKVRRARVVDWEPGSIDSQGPLGARVHWEPGSIGSQVHWEPGPLGARVQSEPGSMQSQHEHSHEWG
eukprot:135581-Chlamydomonas_euryale.AAC.1